MRNTKVKNIKKIILLSFAGLMLSSGVVLAATDWNSFQTQAANGTVNIDSGSPTLQTSGTGYVLGAPPVPGLTVNGNGNTIQGAGSTPSVNNYILQNNQNTLIIHDTNFSNGNVAVENEGTPNATNGGAIQNLTGGTLTIDSTTEDIQSSFTNNTAGNGGALFNQGTANIDKVLFDGNHANTLTGVSSSGLGGAIYNREDTNKDNILTINDSIFQNNDASMFGGAIVNYTGHAVVTGTDFINNSITGASATGADGGAIANRATMEISNSVFTGNSAGSHGGAIRNAHLGDPGVQAAEITISNTTFENNHTAGTGGAISNSGNTNGFVNSVTIEGGTNFVNNYVANGNSATGAGGAIINNARPLAGGTDGLLVINGTADNAVTFSGNVANKGGAIRNLGEAEVNYAVFSSNGNNTINGQNYTASEGGAIHNQKASFTGNELSSADITISNSIFTNNAVTSKGGAIYNKDGNVTVIDSDFAGNTAGTVGSPSVNGGAVYGEANSVTTLRAQNRDMVIGVEDNAASGADSIALNGDAGTSAAATLNLQAAAGKNLIINSDIVNGANPSTSSVDTSKLSVINVGEKASSYNGTVRINGNAQIKDSTININGGTLSFAHDSGIGSSSNRSNIINMNGGTLDLLNYEYSLDQINGLEFNMLDNSNIKLDVNLAQERMDGIFKNNFDSITNNNDSLLTITGMKSTTDALKESVKIQFTDADALIGNVNLGPGANVVEGLIHKYSVTQVTQPVGTMGSDGTAPGEYFIFDRMGNSDSSLVGSVAAQGAFLIMDNLYRQSFANMDMVTLMTPEQRMAWKMRNKYANAGYHTGVYAPNIIPEERDGWYMRPFTNFENVPLKGGPKVSNVSYGSLFGGESDIIELGHGWDGNFSLFGAYHGSHQAYNGVSIWQNGGTIGGVATAYKGNFFTGVTANIGASAARATHSFGTDDFPILMTGAAWKSGYNWGLLNRKLIIQPSYMMSYTFVNVFDFTNGGGVRITQDPLHAIEIIPGIRIIGNLKNGWQPYLGVNMTWNIMDKTKFYANEVALSQLSVKPYIEYGVGLQKRYGDRFTGFGQAMIRNGGRNGIAFTLGLRWALGH